MTHRIFTSPDFHTHLTGKVKPTNPLSIIHIFDQYIDTCIMVVYLSFRKFSTVRGELFLGKTIQFNSGGAAAAERGAAAAGEGFPDCGSPGLEGDEEGSVLASIRNLQGL